jgi:hypothetical protein
MSRQNFFSDYFKNPRAKKKIEIFLIGKNSKKNLFHQNFPPGLLRPNNKAFFLPDLILK